MSKKLYDGGVILVIVFIVVAAIGGYMSSKFLGDDNAVEEQCEDVIEDQMNLQDGTIDLTPSTPEKK